MRILDAQKFNFMSNYNEKVDAYIAKAQPFAQPILQERMLKEIADALARQLVKKLTEKAAAKAAEETSKKNSKEKDEAKKKQKAKEAGEITGLLVNLINTATEKADTRNWQSLPAYIQYVRIPLHKGTNNINIKGLGNITVTSTGGLQFMSKVVW